MTMAPVAARPGQEGKAKTLHHPELTGLVHLGPYDSASTEQILDLLPRHRVWPGESARHNRRLDAAAAIIAWLGTFPGQGWQERWRHARCEDDLDWLTALEVPYSRTHANLVVMLRTLILARVILPSYSFFGHFHNGQFVAGVVQLNATTFARINVASQTLRLTHDQFRHARSVITSVVGHVGRDVDQLTAADILEYRACFVQRRGQMPPGVHAAWALLREIGVLRPQDGTLREQLRPGQKTTTELVDWHELQCRPIRDLLIRYLSERRPNLDYSSFRGLVSVLAGTFWGDIERHHPGIDTLRLPLEVAQQWKERLATVRAGDGTEKQRENSFAVMARVRSFYLDMQQWAAEDPSWVPWALPSPVRRGDTAGKVKRRSARAARIHQRIRERLPLLLDMVETTETHRRKASTMLEAATAVDIDVTFTHDRIVYRRIRPAATKAGQPHVVVTPVETKNRMDLTQLEEDAFWAWAVVEALRHSGLRIEELLELTHLALVSYTPPGTTEVMPLLQIVPSKGNEERLLVVSPELASTLAAIISRVRRRNGGTVALVARYDTLESVTGPPLPHLFQHRNGPAPAVFSTGYVRALLARTLVRADLRNAAGQPLHYTPHDFRRMFATEAVGGGLPIHIAAKVLGHRSIDTTQGYVAVFQDDLIRSYRTFLDQRRSLRPASEYRQPTEEEWADFEQHFELRKVALGTCARPYGTPCQHEHACVRCPVLRVDPRQRQRLSEIARNLSDRIVEAKQHGWDGEIQGLQISLAAAQEKLTALDRAARPRMSNGATNLGIPTSRS